jgi:hypothetical protein
MLTVHLRINDAATGRPTPVRLCVTGPDGTSFPPLGRAAEFPTGRNEDVGGHLKIGAERWYYIDGACEIPLPAEVLLRLRATKGPDYTPIDQTVTLGAGQISLRLPIERRINFRSDGWVSVDARCHFLTPHAARLEAAAEDVDIVNLIARPFSVLAHDGNTYTTTPNLLAFSGQTPAIDADGRAVVVNTLNVHPVMGKVALLHAHRPIFPLAFGGEESDDWSILDWCDQCHRKGGLTVWVDAFESAGGLVGGEALVAAILGKIDAIEVTGEPRRTPLLPWVYRLWDAGFRLPLVGASGKDSNRVAIGQTRTYVRTEGRSWVESVRDGRTVVTDGPLLEIWRDGTSIRAALGAGSMPGRVEIVADGRVLVAGEREVDARIDGAAWVAARCRTTAGGFAHSSPLTIETALSKKDAIATLAPLVEQTREWIETVGRFTNTNRKAAMLTHCDKALEALRPPS